MSKAGCYDSARIEVPDYLGLEEFAAERLEAAKALLKQALSLI
ncbi:hypothetical protein [Pseudobacteriovorax antillogorgiicola]|nr:hypothetical protein [Pseudobacteriovorax antillogorgiicola]